MAKLIVDVKPRGIASAYIKDTPFDKGKEELAKEGYRIISLQENARLRMQEGVDEDISQNGNWVREAAIYVPNKGKFLTKNSPIMANAVEAANCHRSGKDFYLTDEQVEQSLDGAVKLVEKSIPIKRFADDEITAYAFGEDAEKYGEFLQKAGINEIYVYNLADIQDKPFARQMWLFGVGDVDGSDLLGNGGFLCYSYWVRGVQDSAEGAQKNLEAYTLSLKWKTH